MRRMDRALVTGATSGIGAATVRALRASRRDVLAIGRREERLAALAKETGAEVFVADVRDITRISAGIEDFEPDILVNNAGVGHGITGIEGLDSEKVQEAFDINVTAPTQLIAAVLPRMRAQGRGHIVNIGSIAGLHTLVSAVYGGGKSAIHRISQNLRYELSGSGIRVTEICPGRVSSEFYSAAADEPGKLSALADLGITELAPADVASAILYAIDTPPHVNVSLIELMPTEQSVGGVRAEPTIKR
ncbi:MAG: SDR family oxidoreductase [Pseudomonadota bacterium]